MSRRNGDIQLISDVHLDMRDKEMELAPTAHTLVIAGDVAPFVHPKYRDWMEALTHNHRTVAYVPGNHEFYSSPVGPSGALDVMERVCSSLSSNVTLLRAGGSHVDVPGTRARIVGATLWTDIHSGIAHVLETLLNDFAHIRIREDKFITGRDMSVLHAIDRRWIAESLYQAGKDGKRAVVVTHHCPDRRLSANNSVKATRGMGPLYYASDMRPITHSPNLAVWCYGHTHESHVMFLPESRVPFVTNALGYPHEHTGYAAGAGVRLI
jgi:predicted phosphodiesterase